MARQGFHFNVDLQEDLQDDLTNEDKYGRNCTIFVIDCSVPMFLVKADDGRSTHFQIAVEAARNFYNHKCVTMDRDVVGVLLYNTEKSKNSHSFEHIYVLHDLDQPDADKVKELEALTKGDVKKVFGEKYGHADCKLDEMFWMVSTMFSNARSAEGKRQTFVLTNCADPHKGDVDQQKRVKQKIMDLQDLNVAVEVLPIGTDFDYDAFYKPILYEDGVAPDLASNRLEELNSKILRKNYRRRAMANIPFQLGPDVEFGVNLFNMYYPERPPVAVKLDRKTNEEIKTARTYLAAESGEKVLPVDLKKFQVYGGSKVALELDEVDQLRRLCEPGLVLLGFKKKEAVKSIHYIRPGLFLNPNESMVRGGTVLFRALLERCHAKDVVPICRLTARRNMAPKLVALLPQVEVLDEKGAPDASAGFNVAFLPFAEDLRDLDKIEGQPRPNAEPEQVDKAKEVVDKLTIPYDVDSVYNPALQRHYKAIESFALDRDDIEPVDDKTKPDYDWIVRKAGTAIHEFRNLVYSEDYVVGGGKKRAQAAGGGASKKAKLVAQEVNLEEAAKADRLESLTVATLKELAASNGIKLTASRKAEIIGQIKSHYAS